MMSNEERIKEVIERLNTDQTIKKMAEYGGLVTMFPYFNYDGRRVLDTIPSDISWSLLFDSLFEYLGFEFKIYKGSNGLYTLCCLKPSPEINQEVSEIIPMAILSEPLHGITVTESEI